MALFIDSADPEEISKAFDLGVVCGVTTNPILLRKAGSTSLADILKASTGPVSVQVTGDPSSWLAQAKGLFSKSDRVVVKVPCTLAGIQLVKRCWTNRESFNVTGIMCAEQAAIASESGAGYLSVFRCRIRDAGASPELVTLFAVERARWLLGSQQIIVGSIRETRDVSDSLALGANVVTVPWKILQAMCDHPKTSEFVAQCEGE